MNAYRQIALLGTVVVIATQLFSQSPSSATADPNSTATPEWSFLFTTSGYIVPHDRSYVSPTLGVDRRKLHLEARYNYEDQETGSLWAGYNLGLGEKVVLELTPIVGGVFGKTAGIAPGYEMSVTWKKFALSSDGEYVFDARDHNNSFFYSWNELTYSPADWLRIGMVSQRTRAYHTSLDIQRGLLLGFSHTRLDFTTYVLNAGWTDPTVVLSIGYRF